MPKKIIIKWFIKQYQRTTPKQTSNKTTPTPASMLCWENITNIPNERSVLIEEKRNWDIIDIMVENHAHDHLVDNLTTNILSSNAQCLK